MATQKTRRSLEWQERSDVKDYDELAKLRSMLLRMRQIVIEHARFISPSGKHTDDRFSWQETLCRESQRENREPGSLFSRRDSQLFS